MKRVPEESYPQDLPPLYGTTHSMAKNLVIVESPGKVKSLEKFLGKDYKVMS